MSHPSANDRSAASALPASNETLDELLHALGDESAFTAACARAGVYPAVLARLRRGIGTVAHKRTLSRIADALHLPIDRVDAAVRCTRATRNPSR